MTFHIRRAQPKDAAELTTLIYLSKQSNGYDDAFMAACAGELSVSEVDITTSKMWVAEKDGLLGCLMLRDFSGTQRGKISAFFIHPDSKRQGVGRQLWHRVLSHAKRNGLTLLELDSDPEAVPFYEAMGFRVIGQIPSGSIPGRFLPLMEFDLAQAISPSLRADRD
jgi:ribosomal protein S18 acetylase RimI-like enzyme